MPSTVDRLILDVAAARDRFLGAVGSPSAAEAEFRPDPNEWSITQNVEHITLAEQVGINGMWRALEGLRAGRPVWTGDPIHRGRPIEEVIASTWKERELVPEIAAPRWGGPLAFWTAALRSCQPLLEALGEDLERAQSQGIRLSDIVYPHPISGPLDARQRLEFLRFHLDRHAAQVTRIKQRAPVPSSGQ
jgi:hypothetical protein